MVGFVIFCVLIEGMYFKSFLEIDNHTFLNKLRNILDVVEK